LSINGSVEPYPNWRGHPAVLPIVGARVVVTALSLVRWLEPEAIGREKRDGLAYIEDGKGGERTLEDLDQRTYGWPSRFFCIVTRGKGVK
jgi:hypothetical protein